MHVYDPWPALYFEKTGGEAAPLSMVAEMDKEKDPLNG